MNRETASNLGSKIGTVKEIDIGATGDCLGKYIQIRLKVDITRPLEKGIMIDLDEAGVVPALIQ